MRQDVLVEPQEGGEELHKNKFRRGIETIAIKETDGPMTKVKKNSVKNFHRFHYLFSRMCPCIIDVNKAYLEFNVARRGHVAFQRYQCSILSKVQVW